MHTDDPLIITYTNILHSCGVGSKTAEKFKRKHNYDPVFQRRAATLDMLKKAFKK